MRLQSLANETATAAESRPAVVFDLGGVLIDWDPRHLYRKLFTDEAAMEQFLAEVCTSAWNLQMDRGRPFAEAVLELSGRHPDHAPMIAAYHDRWLEMVTGPIRGSVAILEELAARDTRLLALSNWSTETFALVRDDPVYDFLDRFETIFVSGELRLVKPEPEIFRHLLEVTGLAAEACLFIDDNAANVAAAAELGIRTHHFTSPDGLRRDLAAQGLLG
jgi:2-haloacid dehalogenase